MCGKTSLHRTKVMGDRANRGSWSYFRKQRAWGRAAPGCSYWSSLFSLEDEAEWDRPELSYLFLAVRSQEATHSLDGAFN